MPLFYQQNINDSTKMAIWKIDEDEDYFLDKVQLHQQITHPQKRRQHLAGRYLLPYLFPDFPNEEIKVADTRKPFLPNEQYHFSISHCGNIAAAIASSGYRVGIDVEFITPKVERIKHKFLHAEEMRFVNAQPQHMQLQLLSILWSAKEAMFKWFGNGEVDFSEMMRTQPFLVEPEGVIEAAFLKGDFQQRLTLQFKLLGELTAVWVASEV